MIEEKGTVFLKGGNTYITQSATDAYKVKSGSVIIYIVPLKNNELGRRTFLCEVNEGNVFPGFVYRDMEYCDWRFCIVAIDEAKIEIIENGSTRILKQKFSQKAKIKNFNKEGYEGGLVDQYRINIVTEDGFIRRSQYERKEVSENTGRLIFSAFKKNKFVDEDEKTESTLYNSMRFLCNRLNIGIADYEKIKDVCAGDSPTVADIARISHFSYREVVLTHGWHKQDGGPFLVFNFKDEPMLCLPKGSGSYLLYDTENGSAVPVSKKVAATISPKAFMIYRPLPSQKIGFRDITSFCVKSVKVKDIVMLVLLALVTSLIGLLTPIISQKLYDEYIPLGATSLLFQMGCVMGAFMIGNIMFSIVKNLVTFRITSKMAYDMQGAVYNRVFNLPESFFRKYESAELAQYVMGAGGLVNSVASTLISLVVAFIFMVIYFINMAGYTWELTLVSLAMILIYSLIYYFIFVSSFRYKKKMVELEGKTSSIMYQFLSGISKIRIAGVEDRAIYEYLKPYVKLRNNEAKENTIINISEALSLVINSVFSMILYIVLINGNMNISLGAFIAFNTVFGSFAAYSMQVVQGIVSIKGQTPVIEKLKPIFEAEPEFDDANEMPGDISGEIEINNVTFAYSDNSQNVLEGINLTIKPGEYVGLVGPSGCGKSTLLKLMLGFEKPSSGKIYYDNKDIENLDKRELRKKMGVVLQDGKLISGSIYENITITSAKATSADVQNVIKAVGLENDIKEMPMGLHTVLSEDCGTISGGQQQRILIARAIVSKPKILFFDEATSALDNLTQKMVCETLDKMDATRVVIAHRLSTIINCDRIIVLNAGKVEEQGTYEELMENKGLFYQLASRQLV